MIKNILIEEYWNNITKDTEEVELVIQNDNFSNGEADTFTAKLNGVTENIILRDEKIKLAELVEFADSITDISCVKFEDQKQLRWYNFKNIREFTKEILFDSKNTREENEIAYVRLKFFIEELGLSWT